MRPAKKPNQVTLLDERNIARLGIVSIQTRLSSETRWTSEFQIADRRFRVEGRSADGRPRGGDTNVILGIETLFAQKGMPEDNWLHTSAYELREASFLVNNGKNYHRLRESLLRLWSTGFIVSEGWVADTGRTTWANQTLRLIDRITYWDQSEGADPDADRARQLVPDATLSIKLGDQLAASIRAGYTQALDGRLLHQIEQPPARALYRLLEAHRYRETGVRADSVTAGLDDWRAACGISEGKPSRVIRTLEEAHQELIAQGYLESVETGGGRGTAQITYRFRTEDTPDPALVQALREAGVSAPRANVLAKQYPDRVEEAIAFLRLRRSTSPTPIRNPGGLIADFLEHPEKYTLPEEAVPAPHVDPDETRARQERQQEAQERAAQQQFEEEQQVLLALPPGGQWEAAEATLRTLLRRRLREGEWSALETACKTGTLSATSLVREASTHAARGALPEFVKGLRERLGEGA